MEKILRDGMLVGMGNPLLDIQTATDTGILEKYNLQPNDAILAEKKHMPLYEELLENYKVEYIAAGSTLNSVRIAQWILQRPSVCAYIGCVGRDKFSKILEDKSKEDGILAKFQYTSERPTGSCAVLVTSNGHNRSLCANLAAAECFTRDHLDDPEVSKIIANAEFYYSSGFFLTVSIETIVEVAQIAHRRNKYFMMNLSAPFLPMYYKKQMMQTMPYVDILFGNETEALAFAKESNFETSDIKEIALKITTLPKENPNRQRVVIITQGTLPVIVAKDESTTEYPVPLLPSEKIVDTNGAGDAFVGVDATKKGETVGQSLKAVFFFGRFLGIPNENERFNWRNWKTMCSFFFTFWGLFFSIMVLIKVACENFSYSSIGEIAFYWMVTAYVGLFLKLSMEWQDLMKEWIAVDEAMDGLPSVCVYRKIRFITVFLLSFAVCEHSLCQLKEVERAMQCVNHEFTESFYVVSFKAVFKYFPFSPWLGFILGVINFIFTLIWNFTDLFIICVSIALASRFDQLNISLKRVIGQDMPMKFWRESRERYVKLSLLTKSLDERISLLLLLIFANDLYSICYTLYNSFKWREVTTIHMVYNCAAFCLVTLRLFGVCLAAGRIHDLGRQMLPVLFSVPSQSYNIEVHRLFLQLWQDPLSLTGSRFFTITRGLVLKITGTIVTYEIVLAQFNEINTEAEKVNAEVQCA